MRNITKYDDLSITGMHLIQEDGEAMKVKIVFNDANDVLQQIILQFSHEEGIAAMKFISACRAINKFAESRSNYKQ